ncbi:hypothetical protein, partial [Lachnobacterium bovis]|uniref:hypothetical protein n=1 Tax=Lachnobacterium bovis TaxID=140626 RepID=UPI00052508C7
VVGTSLAPNVPLVGSFAQEVKAEENTIPKSLSLTGTVVAYNYSHVAPTSSAVDGWTSEEGGKYYSDENGTPIDGNTQKLIKAYVKYTRTVGDGTSSEPDTKYVEVTVTSTPSQVKFTQPSKPEDLVGPEEYFEDEAFSKKVNFDGQSEDVQNGVITKTVYYKAKDTSKANVTIIDENEAETAGQDIKVTKPTIEQKDEVPVYVSGAPVTIKTGIDTVVKAVLDNIPEGKKIKKVEATYKKDGVDTPLTVSFNETTKEVSIELGKVMNDIAVTIVATVEDVKIKPTIDTSRLKDATAAFEGVTEVKQVGGELVVAVTPADAKYLDDLAQENVITVKTTDGEEFVNAGPLAGRIIFKRVGNFKSATPKVVVSGGLTNNAEETSGKDYSKVEAPYDVSIDNTEVLAAYKALHPDSDKNSAVTITAISTDAVPGVFTNVINDLMSKNENIRKAITVTVTVKGGETVTAATTATADTANAVIPEFNTPIAIKVLLPIDAQGKGGYMALRSHGGRVEKLTQTLVGGEGVAVNGNELTIYTKKLSDFTILYDSSLTSDSQPEPEPIVPDDDKKDDDKKDTPVTPNPTVKPADTKAATS